MSRDVDKRNPRAYGIAGLVAAIAAGLIANFWAVLVLIVVWGLVFSAALPQRQAYING